MLRNIRLALSFTAHHLLCLFISDNGLIGKIPFNLAACEARDVGEMADVIRVIRAFNIAARHFARLDTLREVCSVMEASGIRTAWLY